MVKIREWGIIPGKIKGMTRVHDELTLFNHLFQGVVEVVEESVLNAMSSGQTTQGYRGRIVERLPLEEIIEQMQQSCYL